MGERLGSGAAGAAVLRPLVSEPRWSDRPQGLARQDDPEAEHHHRRDERHRLSSQHVNGIGRYGDGDAAWRGDGDAAWRGAGDAAWRGDGDAAWSGDRNAAWSGSEHCGSEH